MKSSRSPIKSFAEFVSKMKTRSGKLYKQDIPLNGIVRILVKDTRLAAKWPTLARRLKLPEKDILEIQKKGGTQDEILYSTLSYWISRRGSAATIKLLVWALNKDDFIKCAENIEALGFKKDESLNFDGDVEEIEEENNMETEGAVDPDFENMCSKFGNVEVDDYQIVMQNMNDPSNPKEDDVFIQKCLNTHKIDLIVSGTKRSGKQQPQQLKVKLKSKKDGQVSSACRQQITECLQTLKRSDVLSRFKIQALDVQEAQVVEYGNQSFAKPRRSWYSSVIHMGIDLGIASLQTGRKIFK